MPVTRVVPAVALALVALLACALAPAASARVFTGTQPVVAAARASSASTPQARLAKAIDYVKS